MVCREPEIPPRDGFVLEQEDLDLWVIDITFESSDIFTEQFNNIYNHLLKYEYTLNQIEKSYADFALNLEFSLPVLLASLPLNLIDLASRLSISDRGYFGIRLA